VEKIKYVFVPDRNPSRFQNKVKSALIPRLFPFISGITRSRLGWVKYYQEKRGYNSIQMAAHVLQRFYRRFLRQNASLALAQEAGEPVTPLGTIHNAYRHAVCYNCRPSFCSFYFPDGVNRKLWRCGQRLCPFCHYLRVYRLLSRLKEETPAILDAWPSTFLHCYGARFDSSAPADEVRTKITALVRKIGRRRNVVGLVWYFRPLYLKKKHDVIWRARLMVIASADFYLRDDEKQTSGFELVKAAPVTIKGLAKSVGWLMSWGKYPFWFNEEIIAAWNQVLTIGRTYNCSGIARRNYDRSVLDHFYRLAAKARAKVLKRSKRILRKDGSIKPQVPVSLLRASQPSFLASTPPPP
jgi:hypothetical protein